MKSAAHVDTRTAAFPRQQGWVKACVFRIHYSSGWIHLLIEKIPFLCPHTAYTEHEKGTGKCKGSSRKGAATGVFASVLLFVMAKQDPTLQMVSSEEICRQIGHSEIHFGCRRGEA
ncbi:uncharacterized protein NPIL_429291 [Nephila pilipes]|uniref:Uncharacterized protein n=1 Tax=Nephila pilipes TaxID=299642 RepID=A0A8X6UF81_NEPPI|nr:uncharacterized protein NPIL_429291 [Nephila pilipes]